MNIKIFIDTDDDIRIIRRLKRDIIKRNRSFAIGYDSYELALILSANKENNIEFTGMTGRFSSSPRGKLSRKSLKVKVQGGKIKNLNF